MIEINPKYEHLRSFIEKLPERMEDEGVYIYGGRRNLIKMFTAPDGTVLNVKRYHTPNGLNKYIYSYGLRKPKGLRAYLYPSKLAQLGIETPEEVAYIEKRNGHILELSYFVSIQCPYKHLLYEVPDNHEDENQFLAVAFAHFVARMHGAGVLHRDFSPGNILWDKDDDGYHFSVVDINRMRFGEVDAKMGCANFARLWGPLTFFTTLACEYAHSRGFSEVNCVEMVLKYRRKFWEKYSKKHDVGFKLELQ